MVSGSATTQIALLAPHSVAEWLYEGKMKDLRGMKIAAFWSLVLLFGALLFTRTLRNLTTVEAGFSQTGVLLCDLDFTQLNVPKENRLAYKQQILERICEQNQGPLAPESITEIFRCIIRESRRVEETSMRKLENNFFKQENHNGHQHGSRRVRG